MLAAAARVQMTRLSVDVGTDARSAGRREYFEAIQMRAVGHSAGRAGLSEGLAGADAPRELRPLESRIRGAITVQKLCLHWLFQALLREQWRFGSWLLSKPRQEALFKRISCV
jgi:hypothetical protein